MKITLRQLQIFVAIAEHGSTTAAAEQIPLSQSATSAALAELELLLGTSLFDRIGKRLSLNETGRSLLEAARGTINNVQEIERNFGMGEGRSLPAWIRLGASTTLGNYVMPERIAKLLRTEPLTQVQMRIGNTQEIISAVQRLDVDAGVIEGPCHADDLDVQPWGIDELVVVASPEHKLARDSQRCSIEALRAQRWLVREAGSGTRESVDNVLLPHLGGFSSSMQLGSTEAIKQAVGAGLGIACLSSCSVQDLLALGRLTVLTTALPPLERMLYRIAHRSKCFSPSLTRLLEPLMSESTR